MSLSISGGMASGIILDIPHGLSVRPTAVRSRKALFDSISATRSWGGSTVADLFSGAGTLGLEAASRGASEVHLIDSSAICCRIAEANSKKVARAVAEADLRIIVHRADASQPHKSLQGIAGKLDFVLADPPYEHSLDFLGSLTKDEDFANWLGSALLVWELPENSSFHIPPNASLSELNVRKFGSRFFLMASPKK
ncbi:MAG: RsmD family RNA methyltransferase [Victivallales bacterium]|nr:RsmD family RNA methyltransferase [Victivallales bacterium]